MDHFKILEKVDKDYVIKVRRDLHMNPELGFNLPETSAYVKRELDKMGIEYTERFAEGSVVATINPEKTKFTIGFRADMDALPVQEINDVPYKSKIDGRMHACGHDAHTATLLCTAKVLGEIRDEINCRVKLIFQPCEEGPGSGAQVMVDNGVMDDIDVIFGMHVENGLDSGKMGICPGMAMSSSRYTKIEVFGKSAHATLPQSGVDALAVGMQIYNNIQYMLSREMDPFKKWVCSGGTFHAGKTFNVITDYSYMEFSSRAFEPEVDELILRRMTEIAEEVAAANKATVKITTDMPMGSLYNNEKLSKTVLDTIEKIIGKENAVIMPIKMASEDFANYLKKKPGAFFRLGTRNKAKGIGGFPHNNDFQIDEEALPLSPKLCVQLVLDNHNGMDL